MTGSLALLGAGPSSPSSLSAYQSAVLADSPLAYYRLDETAGTTASDSAGTNNGTYTGGFTLAQTGLLTTDPDKAVVLDGTSGYVSVPDVAALRLGTTFTLEAWIKSSNYGGLMGIITKNGGTGFAFYVNAGNLKLYVNGTSVADTVNLTDGTTYLAAVTYDGANARFYLNGTLGASPALTGTPSTSTKPVLLGATDTPTWFFGGTLDEPAIYNTTLTGTRLAAHYAAR